MTSGVLVHCPKILARQLCHKICPEKYLCYPAVLSFLPKLPKDPFWQFYIGCPLAEHVSLGVNNLSFRVQTVIV